MSLLMLDICCGLGGASAAMRDRDWRVVTLDNDPRFKPDILADVRQWTWQGERPDLIWCSPPCTEFAKFAMPCWYDVAALPRPDLSIVEACYRIIREVRPRFWIIENVKGALLWFWPLLGEPAYRQNPYFLWGRFPMIARPDLSGRARKTKELSSSARAERAKIPYALSLAVARAIEYQPELLAL